MWHLAQLCPVCWHGSSLLLDARTAGIFPLNARVKFWAAQLRFYKAPAPSQTQFSPGIAGFAQDLPCLETDLASELKNTSRERPIDLAKRGSPCIRHRRVVPIRPIEGVEGIRLKLQPGTFTEG
jgi:hypothetical protein